MEPLFSDTTRPSRLQDVPAETIISEYAPGQYELTLRYRKDLLRAADDLVLLKRIVRAQARRHGVTACFMAKPIEKYAGSGMHFHVSMLDDFGANWFSEERGRRVGAVAAPCDRRARGDNGRNPCWSLPRTPIRGGASWRSPMRRLPRPGASTTARWRCVFPQVTSKSRRVEHRPAGCGRQSLSGCRDRACRDHQGP